MYRLVTGMLAGMMGVAVASAVLAAPVEACADATRQGDGAAAVRCLEPLAKAGDPQAELLLGEQYATVNEPIYDLQKSAIWFRKAAEHGQLDAQTEVGDLYLHGDGVPKDPAEALKWYRTAADRGDQRAQFQMGLMYFRGWGTPRDVGQAISWERKAADQPGPFGMDAEMSIAEIYRKGDGVPTDYAEAARWFRRAAQHGDPSANLSLAQLDERGLGGPPDPVEAYVEYTLALAWLQNSNAPGQAMDFVTKHRADVAAKLTAEQREAADRSIRDRASSAH